MRILYVTDLHQVFKNPTNRTDLIREGIDITNKIAEELVVEHRIDAIIQGGDLCDRDYTAIPTTINSGAFTAFFSSFLSKVYPVIVSPTL